jgi:hypothetical protein
MVRVWGQEVCSPVISSSNPVVANIIITGDLHGC